MFNKTKTRSHNALRYFSYRNRRVRCASASRSDSEPSNLGAGFDVPPRTVAGTDRIEATVHLLRRFSSSRRISPNTPPNACRTTAYPPRAPQRRCTARGHQHHAPYQRTLGGRRIGCRSRVGCAGHGFLIAGHRSAPAQTSRRLPAHCIRPVGDVSGLSTTCIMRTHRCATDTVVWGGCIWADVSKSQSHRDGPV